MKAATRAPLHVRRSEALAARQRSAGDHPSHLRKLTYACKRLRGSNDCFSRRSGPAVGSLGALDPPLRRARRAQGLEAGSGHKLANPDRGARPPALLRPPHRRAEGRRLTGPSVPWDRPHAAKHSSLSAGDGDRHRPSGLPDLAGAAVGSRPSTATRRAGAASDSSRPGPRSFGLGSGRGDRYDLRSHSARVFGPRPRPMASAESS
jgi:hypothetical protein